MTDTAITAGPVRPAAPPFAGDWHQAEHELLHLYVRVVPRLFDVERCSIFIASRDDGHIWLRAGTGLDERAIEVDPRADSVVGEVIRTGRRVLRGALGAEQGEHRSADAQTGFETRDILCLPILSPDSSRVTGAVELLNRRSDGDWADDDLELLDDLVVHLQHSIEHIYHDQESRSATAMLHRMLRWALVGGALVLGALVLLLLAFWGGVAALG